MATHGPALKTENGERDAVMKAMQSYIDGLRLGSSEVMRSGFHEGATISGCVPGGVIANPIKTLFDWIDKNGPSPNLQTEFRKVEVLESIAVRSPPSSRSVRSSCGKRRTYVRYFYFASNR
jgi:hypothetical protein